MRALVLLLMLSIGFGASARAGDEPGRLKILGLSLLLPGLGHRALGHMGRAEAMMSAEAGIWIGYGSLRIQGQIRKDSYVEMAQAFAGVPKAGGRSDDYYRLLGDFRDSSQYNDEVRRDARARFPDDLAGRAAYFESHRMPADRVWSWDSSADWRRYRDKRGDSLRSFKRSQYMIGLAVANRLFAAVDAMRAVHRRSEPSLGLIFSSDPFASDPSARVGLSLRLP